METLMSVELPPDIEASLRGEAALRGVSVDVVLREALAAYVRSANGGPAGIRRVPCRKRLAEMAWAAHPEPQFIGNWVALDGDRVLAAGPDAKAVYDQARRQGIEVPFVTYASPHAE